MGENLEIYLLKADSVITLLNILKKCCPIPRPLVSTMEKPLLKVWAAKLTISEAADVLDKGIDVSKFDSDKHDPHGIIQNKLNINFL